MDLLLQMAAAPDGDQSRLDLAELLRDQGIVTRLIDFISPSADPEVSSVNTLCTLQYPFFSFPKSKFSVSGQKPWTIVRGLIYKCSTF